MKTSALRLFLLPALTLALLAALGVVVWADNAANRGLTFTPDPRPIPFAGGPILGVNLYNLHLEPDPAAVRRSFALARELGARYARMQAPWEDIEIHARGDFEDRRNLATVGAVSAWAKYDRLAAEANAAGIELIWRLERPPLWARAQAVTSPYFQAGLARDGNSTGPPDDFADYGAFVRAVVERYDGDGLDDAPGSPVVRYFQLWNEPNLKNEWGWETPRPEDFVALLRVGATAARAANPAVVILFPGLAPTDGLDDRAPMTELEYLDRVYRAGGAAYFDVMAAQNYGLGQPPDEHRFVFLRGRENWNWRRPLDTRNDVSRIVLLREVMERNGDAGTAIWVTEFGWNTAPEHIPAERRYTWGAPVSEETRGRYLVGHMERARAEWPWIGVMNVWMLRYGGYAEPDPEDPTPYFALVTRDWQPLPAFEALAAYTRAPARAGVGAHTRAHPAVELLPDGWRIRFTGSRLTLLGNLRAPVVATLDGAPVTLAPGELDGLPAFAAPALPNGEHTLELRGAEAPERFIVERARSWGWLWDYGPLALIVALMASVSATLRLAFPAALGAWQRLRVAQRRAEGSPRLVDRLIQPDSLIAAAMLVAVLIAYRASAQLPLTLAGLALFGALALARPALALLVVPLAVPFYFIPKGLFDTRFGIRESGLYLPLHELLLLIAGAAVVARWVGTEPWQRGRPRTGDATAWLVELAPIGLFVAAAAWGVYIAEARTLALREFRWTVLGPLLFVGLAWLAGTRLAHGSPTVYWRRLVWFWLAGGALAGLVGLLQFVGLNLAPLFGEKAGFGEDRILVEGVQRVAGLYGHPNNLGLAMGRYWPVAAALASSAFWGAASRGDRLRQAWPAALVAVLCGGGLLVSFSRGAYLGALVAAGLLAALLLPGHFWRDRRVRLGLIFLGGVMLLALAVALNIERFNPVGASGVVRLKTWAAALTMLREHPAGVGLDQFGRLYPAYMAPELAGTSEINTSHPHNLILDIALRMGPPGLIAFAWLIVRFYRDARAGLRRGDAVCAGLIAAMSAALVHGMVDQFYFWTDLAFAFWIFVALARNQRLRRTTPE